MRQRTLKLYTGGAYFHNALKTNTVFLWTEDCLVYTESDDDIFL